MAEGQTDRLTQGGCGVAAGTRYPGKEVIGTRGAAGHLSRHRERLWREKSWLEYRSLREEGPRGLLSVGCSPDSGLTQSSVRC